MHPVSSRRVGRRFHPILKAGKLRVPAESAQFLMCYAFVVRVKDCVAAAMAITEGRRPRPMLPSRVIHPTHDRGVRARIERGENG